MFLFFYSSIHLSYRFSCILLLQMFFHFVFLFSLGMTIVCATNEGLFARCKKWDFERIKFDFVRSGTGLSGNLNILFLPSCSSSFFYSTSNFLQYQIFSFFWSKILIIFSYCNYIHFFMKNLSLTSYHEVLLKFF